MLGKRPRSPSIKRTTSMSGITVDVSTNTNDDEIQSTPSNYNNYPASKGLGGLNEQSSVGAILSPRYFRRAAADGGGGGDNSMEPPPFLKACRLCNCQLAPGRDIFMYRGDTAFCSEECREQIMKQDERKEKTNQKAVKTGRTTASKSSENGGETTIIAA